jgi:hypothetical protein
MGLVRSLLGRLGTTLRRRLLLGQQLIGVPLRDQLGALGRQFGRERGDAGYKDRRAPAPSNRSGSRPTLPGGRPTHAAPEVPAGR